MDCSLFSFDDYYKRDSDDVTTAMQRLFDAVSANGGGTATIPAGEYALSGEAPIRLCGRCRVVATGAHFHLPETLAEGARLVLFAGENVRDFSWTGGSFHGHGFDPERDDNAWQPNASTRVFVITTSEGGATRNIAFRDVEAEGIAGAVVNVFGQAEPGSASEIAGYATDIALENCRFVNSGKFMWDYGFLWQIVVWPEEHTPRERELAARYFPHDLVRGGIAMNAGDDRVRFDNSVRPLPVAASDDRSNALCFFGGALPAGIVRGKRYFIVESGADFIKVSDRPHGEPIAFKTDGRDVGLIHNMYLAYYALYEPTGSGPGKGGFDLVGCRNVRVSGCRLSARGDTMHIQRSRDILFAGNQIIGSRMGAFFLAEYCRNAVVSGNTIDGTNGSRVMSVEKSAEDVVITGNTFRGGGRGSWINQPRNIAIVGNIFQRNTTKSERTPRTGRKIVSTGDYETYPEMYFTTHEEGGRYDSVIVKDNVFETGPGTGPAMTFAAGGSAIVVKDNVFKGEQREIAIDPSCTEVNVEGNIGATSRRRIWS